MPGLVPGIQSWKQDAGLDPAIQTGAASGLDVRIKPEHDNHDGRSEESGLDRTIAASSRIRETWPMIDAGYIVREVLNAATVSIILILISLGLSVIFGLMRILNTAHGEFVILGAYVVVGVTRGGGSFWLGVAVAPVALALFGYLFQKSLLRFLYRNWTTAILVTWGASIIIRQVLQLSLGPRPWAVANPFPGSIELLDVQYPMYRIVIIAIGLALLAGIWWAVMRTTLGLQVRLAIQNREMAAALGIDTQRINAFAFVVGAALAGLAGALVSPLVPVGPLTGLHYLIDCFFVIILGGAGDLLGTLAGGAVIGGGESILQIVTKPVIAEIMIYVVAIALLCLRPQGLVRQQ
jgi:branched-chain amino acid transport system permease protein/urea transport system permease protein